MDAEVITFGEVRQRAGIDIIGGTFEMYVLGCIQRASINDIQWQNDRPRFIILENLYYYDSDQQTWKSPEQPCAVVSFESPEDFSKLLELETRPIIFLFCNILPFVIYPIGYELAEEPMTTEQLKKILTLFT